MNTFQVQGDDLVATDTPAVVLAKTYRDGRTVTWARKRIASGKAQPGDVEAVAAHDAQAAS